MTHRLALMCASTCSLVACGGVEPGYRSSFGGEGKFDTISGSYHSNPVPKGECITLNPAIINVK
jgi:hypothetical protein